MRRVLLTMMLALMVTGCQKLGHQQQPHGFEWRSYTFGTECVEVFPSGEWRPVEDMYCR